MQDLTRKEDAREYFLHMETLPLSVKDCKSEAYAQPLLGAYSFETGFIFIESYTKQNSKPYSQHKFIS